MANYEFIVEDLKIRLDKYLAQQLPEISRSQIQRDIEGGNAEVNGQPILESKFVVRVGDKVIYKVESGKWKVESLKATNTPLKILYNDHGLLIIDKPAGMVVHPGAGFKGETLASALLYMFSAEGGSPPKADQPSAGTTNLGGKNIHLVGEEHRPGIVHRLDKDTSGVILVATTQEMYEHLKNAFAERKIKKEYIALVLGRVEKSHGFIETSIGKSNTDFRKMAVIKTSPPTFVRLRRTSVGAPTPPHVLGRGGQRGKEAVTEYKVLEYLTPHPSASGGHLLLQGEKGNKKAGLDGCTLLRLKLHTGRTHQIRVHLSSIGHPLIGDELYGGKKVKLENLSRQFLHAKKIEVRLSDGTWIEAESELPEDLREVLVSLNSKVVRSL